MSTDEFSTRPAPRNPDINLEPDTPFAELMTGGLVPSGVRVRERPELDAVQLAVVSDDGEAEVEVLLTPGAAVEMAVRLTSAAVRVAVRGGL